MNQDGGLQNQNGGNMNENFIAKASIAINASRQTVWQALMSPDAIKEYMFGARVDSDWREGSPISWTGEWQGKSYEDKGTILQVPSAGFSAVITALSRVFPTRPNITIRSPSSWQGTEQRPRSCSLKITTRRRPHGCIQRRTGR